MNKERYMTVSEDIAQSCILLPAKRFSEADNKDVGKKVCIDLTEDGDRDTVKKIGDGRFVVTAWFEAEVYCEKLRERSSGKRKEVKKKVDVDLEDSVIEVSGTRSTCQQSESELSAGRSKPTVHPSGDISSKISIPSSNTPNPALIDLEVEEQFELVNQHLSQPISILEDDSPPSSSPKISGETQSPVPSKSFYNSVIILNPDASSKPVTCKKDLFEIHTITEMVKGYFKLSSLQFRQVNSYNNNKFTSSIYINNELISFTESHSSNQARAKAALIALYQQDSTFCEEWLERNEKYMKDFLGVKE
jgi:hypothetical protein